VTARFSVPVQTGPGAHPASCKTGTGSFPGVKIGRGVRLSPHPLLVPSTKKGRAIPLLPLWAYGLYRALVPVQGCTLTFTPANVLCNTKGTYLSTKQNFRPASEQHRVVYLMKTVIRGRETTSFVWGHIVQLLPSVLDANFPTELSIFDNVMTGRNQDGDIKRIWSETCSLVIVCNFIFPSQTSTFPSILPPVTQSLEAKLLSLPTVRLPNSTHQRIAREANLCFPNQQIYSDLRKTGEFITTLCLFSTTHCSLKAYCAIWIRRSNFRHQASQRVSPRESTQRRKVELWERNVR